MTEYLSSLDQASRYQGLVLRPLDAPEKKCQHEGQLYLKCGKAFRVHDASWKAKQGIAAFALTLLALLILPLMFKSYCKLVGKLWQQCTTGKENFALYLLQNRTSSSSSSQSETSSSSSGSTSATSSEEEAASGRTTKSSSDSESSSSVSDNSGIPKTLPIAPSVTFTSASHDGSKSTASEESTKSLTSDTESSSSTSDNSDMPETNPNATEPATLTSVSHEDPEGVVAEKAAKEEEPQLVDSTTIRDQKLMRIRELLLLSKLKQKSQTARDVNSLPKVQPDLSQQATKEQEKRPYPFSAEKRHELEVARAEYIKHALKFQKAPLDEWDLKVANATLKRAERIKGELMPLEQK